MILPEINIAVIGAGKISYSIVDALKKAGFTVNAVISKNINSAQELAQKFDVGIYSNKIENIPDDTNFFMLSVPDSSIKTTADNLSLMQFNFHESIFIHFSGAETVKQLNSLKDKGATTVSFHIMQTFPTRDVVRIEGASVAIEAESEKASRMLFELAEKLKLKPFVLKSEQKIFYHLAGVFASNFLVSNLYASQALLGDVSSTAFQEIIQPIVNATLENIKKNGIIDSISGPVDRGDLLTVQNHVEALKREETKLGRNVLYNYIIQSLTILEVVKKKYGNLSAAHKEIYEYLKKQLDALEKF